MSAAPTTDVRRLWILLCGYEIIRRSGCLRGASGRLVLAVPVCAYLVETARGFVLFDTGLDATALADPARAARLVDDVFPAPPVVLPEHDLLRQLAGIGVEPGMVNRIVLSHVHADHTGHLRSFPNARVTIQRREFEAAFLREAQLSPAFPDISDPAIDWDVIDGDTTLMPGFELLLTPGHRPGHQSAVLDLPRTGVKILTGDVVDLLENFDQEILGSSMDDAAALASLRRLKAIARETGGELVPLHDPGFVERARLAPEFYG